MSSKHRSLQTSTTTLPQSNGDRDFEIDFEAPALSESTNVHARPYIAFKANPAGNGTVRLLMELNETEIVDETLGSDTTRQLFEIFDHGVLQRNGNTLRVFVPDEEPGTITVSDIVVVYTAA